MVSSLALRANEIAVTIRAMQLAKNNRLELI